MALAKYFEDNEQLKEERLVSVEQEKALCLPSHLRVKVRVWEEYPKITPPKKKGTPKRKPQNITCVICQEIFCFKEGEQAYFKRHKLATPKRCPSCRKRHENGHTIRIP